MCKKGYKPCISDMSFVSSTSWYGCFKRFVQGENRDALLLYINNVIESSIECLAQYKYDSQFYSLIISGLCHAKEGIENLKYTYTSYPHIVSTLIVDISRIDIILSEHKQRLD